MEDPKIFRLSYLSINALHMILAEEWREGVNSDRIPRGGIRVKVLPGEDLFLQGDDVAEFRQQLDQAFPKPARAASPRTTLQAEPVDPITGDPLRPGETVIEG